MNMSMFDIDIGVFNERFLTAIGTVGEAGSASLMNLRLRSRNDGADTLFVFALNSSASDHPF